ncbi:MAG TPA: hypothetical protein VIA82_02395, partial [Candidatus Limnocylindria bacterium]
TLRRLSILAAVWALGYALYRAYYGFGGQLGMIGVPAAGVPWRAINLIGAGALLGAAILPIVALHWWTRPVPRRLLLGAAWVIAVGCIMHALVDGIGRAASLVGILEIRYPLDLWQSVDLRQAFLQDLLFNEPWFFVEGLLWAAIAWHVLGRGRRSRWLGSAMVAILGLTVIGLLSSFGVVGRFVVF